MPAGLKPERIAPMSPIKRITANTRLAGFSSFPMMPTARFTQMRARPAATAIPTAYLYVFSLILLEIHSYERPDPNRRAPAMRKSNGVQATSLVNRMATKGISNKNPTMIDRRMTRCFCKYMWDTFSFRIPSNVSQQIHRTNPVSRLFDFIRSSRRSRKVCSIEPANCS